MISLVVVAVVRVECTPDVLCCPCKGYFMHPVRTSQFKWYLLTQASLCPITIMVRCMYLKGYVNRLHLGMVAMYVDDFRTGA